MEKCFERVTWTLWTLNYFNPSVNPHALRIRFYFLHLSLQALHHLDSATPNPSPVILSLHLLGHMNLIIVADLYAVPSCLSAHAFSLSQPRVFFPCLTSPVFLSHSSGLNPQVVNSTRPHHTTSISLLYQTHLKLVLYIVCIHVYFLPPLPKKEASQRKDFGFFTTVTSIPSTIPDTFIE